MKNNLLEGKISRLIRSFAIPSTIGLMIGVVYNIVDRMFIAKGIGRLGIAGVSITLPITTFYLSIGLLIGVGVSVLISISLGKKDVDKVERLIGTALTTFIIIGILCTVLFQVFLKDILILLGAGESTLPYAMEYSRYLIFGSVFLMIIPGFNNIIRGTGSPKSVMIYSLIGAILNIFLDWVLIIQLNQGMKGAAIATIISLGISASLMMNHYISKKNKIRIKVKYMKIDKTLLKEIIGIGSGPFMLQLASAIIVIVINNRFKLFGGDIYIAAYGIINSLVMLIRLPTIGIQQASQTIIAYNYGAKRYDRIIETYYLSMKIVAVISTIGFIMAQFFPQLLVNMFISDDPQLVEVAVKGVRLFFASVFLQGINIISCYLFMALGKGKVSLNLNIFQQLMVTLPIIYILPIYMGAEGAWLGVPIAEVLTAFIVLSMAHKKIKELKLLQRGDNINGEGNKV